MTEQYYTIKLKVHTTLRGDLEKIAIELGTSVGNAVVKAMKKYNEIYNNPPQIISAEPLKI